MKYIKNDFKTSKNSTFIKNQNISQNLNLFLKICKALEYLVVLTLGADNGGEPPVQSKDDDC